MAIRSGYCAPLVVLGRTWSLFSCFLFCSESYKAVLLGKYRTGMRYEGDSGCGRMPCPHTQRNNDDIRQTTKNSPYQLWVIPALPSPSTSESIAVRPLQSLSSFVAQVLVPRRVPKTNARHTHLPTFSFATELARCVDVARALVELLLRTIHRYLPYVTEGTQ